MTNRLPLVQIPKPSACQEELPKWHLVKTKHIRDAMAEALRDYVNTIKFSFPASTEPKGFAAVYRSWAQFEDRAVSTGGALPAATVLPGELVHVGDILSPRMMPGTWHQDTEDGKLYSLWHTEEAQTEFLIVTRAASSAQRDAINLAIEDAFTETGAPGHLPARKGKLLPMPSYFGRKARFTLLNQQNLDTEAAARENRWMAQFEILGNADVVRKVEAPRFRPHIGLTFGTEGDPSEDCG